jgi:hypothetical protein
VPLPISRREALEGGDVTLEYATVEDSDELPVPALLAAAKAQGPVLETAFAPAENAVVETAAFKAFDALANAEKVPLPIWRRTALKGGDVTVRFVAVEDAKDVPSVVPTPAPRSEAGVERPAKTVPVQFANYVRVAEKARQIGLPGAREEPNISTAAKDDPRPIVPASQFSRRDLPVFLLRKLDGGDQTAP